MSNNKNQNTMIGSSQKPFFMMAALAGSLSLTTTPVLARDEQAIPSIGIMQTYDYSSTYVQSTIYASSKKKNFRERYAQMVKSEWYRKAYENKSVGDLIEIDY